MPIRPALILASEFAKTKVERGTPVLIYFTPEEFEKLTAGRKPVMGREPLGPGLHIIPIPGQPGFVGFPVCGPDQVPVVGPGGQVHCVYSEFEDTTEPRTEIPGTGCHWSLAPRTLFRCQGTCSGGRRCISRFQITSSGFFISCRCPIRVPPLTVGSVVG